jgi:hypothetical protein
MNIFEIVFIGWCAVAFTTFICVVGADGKDKAANIYFGISATVLTIMAVLTKLL